MSCVLVMFFAPHQCVQRQPLPDLKTGHGPPEYRAEPHHEHQGVCTHAAYHIHCVQSAPHPLPLHILGGLLGCGLPGDGDDTDDL